jgi:hypothetical protein
LPDISDEGTLERGLFPAVSARAPAPQTPPRHPGHQWELKPTGLYGVKVPLGRATFVPDKLPIDYIL